MSLILFLDFGILALQAVRWLQALCIRQRAGARVVSARGRKDVYCRGRLWFDSAHSDSIHSKSCSSDFPVPDSCSCCSWNKVQPNDLMCVCLSLVSLSVMAVCLPIRHYQYMYRYVCVYVHNFVFCVCYVFMLN